MGTEIGNRSVGKRGKTGGTGRRGGEDMWRGAERMGGNGKRLRPTPDDSLK